jgi:hypothetical protein
MKGFQLILVLLPIAFWSCAPATAASPPAPSEVKTLLEKGYQAPALHSLTPVAEGDRVVKWVRRYNGIEMLSDTKTVLVDGVWQTRWVRELAEPEPVRRGDLISDQHAAQASGLSREFSEQRLRTRLVYDPVYIEIPKTPHVQNATDVDWAIEKYQLAIEVMNPAESTLDFVDAYTGELIRRVSGRHDVKTTVAGRRYPSVTIDAIISGDTTILRDPVRVSRHVPSNGSPINGQGLVDGLPTSTAGNLKYLTYSLGVDADAAFAISQAWDFFRAAFGRRGLRDLPDFPLSFNNDAVVAYDPSDSSLNAYTTDDPSTGINNGVITVNSGAPDFAYAAVVNLEILGHEWSHAVFNADVGSMLNNNIGETGGIDEANADIFGKLIKMRGLAFLENDSCHSLTCQIPQIVEIPHTASAWIFGNEDPLFPPNALRDMCVPHRSGQIIPGKVTPDIWNFDMKMMDQHLASGPINRMFCLLVRGIVPNAQAGGDPDLKTGLVPDGFAGIGTEQAARIWYAALPFLKLKPMPIHFIDAREASLSAAIILSGKKYSLQYKAVEDAFAAIFVGTAADRTPPTIAFTSEQSSPTEARIIVDIADPHNVESGKVVITSSAHPGVIITQPCTGHCIFSIDPAQLGHGTHTVTVTATDVPQNTVTKNFNSHSTLRVRR